MTTSRRGFLKTTAIAATVPLWATPRLVAAPPTPKSAAETAVKALYDSLNDKQKAEICFAWDHQEKGRGLLRTFTANNWQVTKPMIRSEYYTKSQQTIIHDIFRGLVSPEWYERFVTQAKEDSGGKAWGSEQSIAIFGVPGSEQFEFVLSGRHQTLRADGNTEKHVAFGGPIFYGHAAGGDDEEKDHPGNVFWSQAVAANKVAAMLSGKQREQALVAKTPREYAIGFRGAKITEAPGLPVTELTADQKTELQTVLGKLLEPFRTEDRDEAMACLKAQGGLDGCKLSFYTDADIGDDKVWDNWRVEGPAFVWHFRGSPHVHVWVNVADDPAVVTNAK
ncbi:MAG: DUF3500 domain-containing protein [Fimbriiglobus sp.]